MVSENTASEIRSRAFVFFRIIRRGRIHAMDKWGKVGSWNRYMGQIGAEKIDIGFGVLLLSYTTVASIHDSTRYE